MKEIYESPEAKLICFQALESIARSREDLDRRGPGDSGVLNPNSQDMGVGGGGRPRSG